MIFVTTRRRRRRYSLLALTVRMIVVLVRGLESMMVLLEGGIEVVVATARGLESMIVLPEEGVEVDVVTGRGLESMIVDPEGGVEVVVVTARGLESMIVVPPEGTGKLVTETVVSGVPRLEAEDAATLRMLVFNDSVVAVTERARLVMIVTVGLESKIVDGRLKSLICCGTALTLERTTKKSVAVKRVKTRMVDIEKRERCQPRGSSPFYCR